MQETTRVLIVDDSPSMRRLIRMGGIETDPRIEVIAEAGSAREAREAVNQHEPDVMTLDVMMPEIDGLEFLRRLMRARPMPVLMVSSLTGKGSEEAVRALSLGGAVDCLEKPRFGSAGKLYKQLAEMLVVAAKARCVVGDGACQPCPAPVPTRNGRTSLSSLGGRQRVGGWRHWRRCFPAFPPAIARRP